MLDLSIPSVFFVMGEFFDSKNKIHERRRSCIKKIITTSSNWLCAPILNPRNVKDLREQFYCAEANPF